MTPEGWGTHEWGHRDTHTRVLTEPPRQHRDLPECRCPLAGRVSPSRCPLPVSAPQCPTSASCSCPLPVSMSVLSVHPPVSPGVPPCHTVSMSAPCCPSPFATTCSRSCPCVPPIVSVCPPRVHVHLSHPCPSVCGHPLACPSMSILPNPCPSMTIVSPSPRVTAPLSPPHRVRVHPVTSVSLCVPRVPPCPPSHIHPFMAVSTLSCPCPCFSGPCPPCHLYPPCPCPPLVSLRVPWCHCPFNSPPRVHDPPCLPVPGRPPPSCPCPSVPTPLVSLSLHATPRVRPPCPCPLLPSVTPCPHIPLGISSTLPHPHPSIPPSCP